MEFKAFKMDGLGNDFVIIDQRHNHIELTNDQIKKICNRRGIFLIDIAATVAPAFRSSRNCHQLATAGAAAATATTGHMPVYLST